jgi:transcriptional regulator with XRE-family HTH domain
MAYATQQIAATLKAAREALALSQRALGERVGLPQSHVSKIEAGAVDLKLSSLIELARALDLDVVLVPRKFLPAVEAIIRPNPAIEATARDRLGVKQVRMLQKEITELGRVYPDASHLRRLRDTARGLTNLRLGPAEVARVTEAQRLLKRIKAGKASLDDAAPLAEELRELRNRLAHPVDQTSPQRPAYQLDDGEQNA